MHPIIFTEGSSSEESPKKLPNRHLFIRLMRYVAKRWYLFIIGVTIVLTALIIPLTLELTLGLAIALIGVTMALIVLKDYRTVGLTLGLTLIVFVDYLRIVPRLMTREVLNVLTPPVVPERVYEILPIAVFTIIGVSMLSNLISFGQRYLQSYISQKVVYNIRKDLFNALIQKSFSFYDKSRVGDIVSRVTSDTDQVQSMTSMWVNEVVSIVAQFVIWIGVLVSINAPMTAICLVSAPFTVLITNKYAKVIGPIYTAQRRLFAEMNTFLQQNIVGMRVVRIFRQKNRE